MEGIGGDVEPDRELDAWLAERFDLPCNALSIVRGRCGHPYTDHPRQLEASDHAYVPPMLSSTGDGLVAVAEAMRAGGWSVEVSWIEDGEPWYAAFTSPAGVFQRDAPTAPLAVARAARATLEAVAEQ